MDKKTDKSAMQNGYVAITLVVMKLSNIDYRDDIPSYRHQIR